MPAGCAMKLLILRDIAFDLARSLSQACKAKQEEQNMFGRKERNGTTEQHTKHIIGALKGKRR